MIVILYEPQGAFLWSIGCCPGFKAVAERPWPGDLKSLLCLMTPWPIKHSHDAGQKNVGYGEDFLSLFEYVGMPYKKKSRNRG